MELSAPLRIRQILRTMGLTDNEIKILLTLLEHKKLTLKDLSKYTTISFDVVHYATHTLVQKGLVRTPPENGEESVEVCSEAEFMNWIDTQRKLNEEVYDNAKMGVEAYFSSLEEKQWKPSVTYFEGAEGVMEIYEDMVATGKDIYCWTDIEKIDRTLGPYMEEFIKKRVQANITTHAIMPTNAMNSRYAEKNEKRLVLFSDNLPIEGEIRIYGDKVAVITFHEERPVGFVFSGPVISSLFRAVFASAWDKPTT